MATITVRYPPGLNLNSASILALLRLTSFMSWSLDVDSFLLLFTQLFEPSGQTLLDGSTVRVV